MITQLQSQQAAIRALTSDSHQLEEQIKLCEQYYGISQTCNENDEKDCAESIAREGIVLANTLHHHNDSDAVVLCLARGHTNLARILEGRGRSVAAASEYRKAITLLERQLIDQMGIESQGQDTTYDLYAGLGEYEGSKSANADIETLQSLSYAHYRLASLLEKEGDYVAAEISRRNDVSLSETLLSLLETCEAEKEFLLSIERMGQLQLTRHELSSAEKLFRQEVTVAESLAERTEGASAAKRDLSIALGLLGKTLLKEGKSRQAATAIERELELADALYTECQSSVHQRRLVRALENTIALYKEHGDTDAVDMHTKRLQAIQ